MANRVAYYEFELEVDGDIIRPAELKIETVEKAAFTLGNVMQKFLPFKWETMVGSIYAVAAAPTPGKFYRAEVVFEQTWERPGLFCDWKKLEVRNEK